MKFVCPQCKGPLAVAVQNYGCTRCARDYPVVCGIPDFRLHPDPYIGMEMDRRKGMRLLEEAGGAGFAGMVRFYYAITPEVPPEMAEEWTRHTLAGVTIAEQHLHAAGLQGAQTPAGAWLDVGCSTGALLQAARGHAGELVGVDVAFRWLVAGRLRLQEAGVAATLVCANAEHLPFPDGAFSVVTATDAVEHFRDAVQSVREAARVCRPGARLLLTTNNRFAPLPEPHVRMWGVGYLPRRWQPAYVSLRRNDIHYYHVCLRSARELNGMFRQARFRRVRTEAAPLFAPHCGSSLLQRALAAYNTARQMPLLRTAAALLGPRVWTLAER